MIRIVTLEREFGCGGPEIARKLAVQLGWKLWDEPLTLEVARLAKSAPEAVERREWKMDPLVYRVFKSFFCCLTNFVDEIFMNAGSAGLMTECSPVAIAATNTPRTKKARNKITIIFDRRRLLSASGSGGIRFHRWGLELVLFITPLFHFLLTSVNRSLLRFARGLHRGSFVFRRSLSNGILSNTILNCAGRIPGSSERLLLINGIQLQAVVFDHIGEKHRRVGASQARHKLVRSSAAKREPALEPGRSGAVAGSSVLLCKKPQRKCRSLFSAGDPGESSYPVHRLVQEELPLWTHSL